MRALQLLEDRKSRDRRPAAAAAAGARRGDAAHQGRRAQPHRRVGLARHGVRQAQAADRRSAPRRPARSTRSARASADSAPGQLVSIYGAETCGLCRPCRDGRDNLCENVARRARLPPRRLRAGEDQPAGPAAGAGAARRRRRRRGVRAGHLRHASSTCCSTTPSSSPARRSSSRPAAPASARPRSSSPRRIGCTVITTVGSRRQDRQGQGARRRSRHQLPRGALRGRGAQAHQEAGRRRRLRACRRRHLGRLDVLAEARRPARHLRLDHRRVDARSTCCSSSSSSCG